MISSTNPPAIVGVGKVLYARVLDYFFNVSLANTPADAPSLPLEPDWTVSED